MIVSRKAAGVAAIAALASFASCGVEIEGADSERQEFVTERAVEQNELRDFRAAAASLPPRPDGEVAVAGETPESLTAGAAIQFNRAATGVDVSYEAIGVTAAFASLCEGTADVVEVARPISEEELAACEANGVELSAPLQMASDAIVVATRNESDVGGDCVGVPDVDAIFRRGSTIDNWLQLGFDDLRLIATGPIEGSTFEFFTSRVFGDPAGGSLADFRADYRAEPSDVEVKDQITNRNAQNRAKERAREYKRKLKARLAGRRQEFINEAEARADARALEEIERINRRNRRLEIEVDAEELEQQNAELVERAKARARERAVRFFDARVDERVELRREEKIDRALGRGSVGYVNFAFYELYEEQLRPLEMNRAPEPPPAPLIPDPNSLAIAESVAVPPVEDEEEVDESAEPDCIFPSQETITTGQYPLSQRTLLYVPTRSLEREEVERFLAAYLADADQLALAAGLVPIPEQLRAEQFELVTGRRLEAAEETIPEPTPIPGEAPADPAEPAEPVESVPGVAG